MLSNHRQINTMGHQHFVPQNSESIASLGQTALISDLSRLHSLGGGVAMANARQAANQSMIIDVLRRQLRTSSQAAQGAPVAGLASHSIPRHAHSINAYASLAAGGNSFSMPYSAINPAVLSHQNTVDVGIAMMRNQLLAAGLNSDAQFSSTLTNPTERTLVDYTSSRTEAGWEEQFRALCKYHSEFGHCRVPARYKSNTKLG